MFTKPALCIGEKRVEIEEVEEVEEVEEEEALNAMNEK